MRRAVRILLWTVAAIVLVPVLLVAAVVLALNTGPGRGLAEALVARATGGSVVVQGLAGRFPDRLRVARLALGDADGIYAEADAVELDWSPLALIQRRAEVDLLEIGRLAVPRLPASSSGSSSSSSSSSPFSLPVTVEVKRVHVGSAEIGAPLLGGISAVLALDGGGRFRDVGDLQVKLDARRIGGGGAYAADVAIDPAQVAATVTVSEPPSGLVAHLARLPDLGPLRLGLAAKGPRRAVATTFDFVAGPLVAHAGGAIDLQDSSADLAVTASAPAMTPAPGVAWQSVRLDAKVHGPFAAPDATGQLAVTGLEAGGAGVRTLTADVAGNAGRVTVHAVADQLRVPGPNPALLQSDPLTLDATVQLDDPARPVVFSVSHPLLRVSGQARTAGTPEVTADVALPQLAPFAAVGGIDLHGSTALRLHAVQGAATTVEADGTLDITGGLAPLPGLVGQGAKLAVRASLHDGALQVSHLGLAGRTLTLDGAASRTAAGVLDAQVNAGLSDLAVVAPTLTGALQLQAHAGGPADRLAVSGTVAGELGAPNVPRGPVKLAFDLTGLPTAPSGTVTADATLENAPLRLAVDAARDPAGAITATIRAADWRSLHVEGKLSLPAGGSWPLGAVHARMGQLGDLSPFVGRPVSGSLALDADLQGSGAKIRAEATNAGIPGSRIGHAVVNATVADPLRAPVVTADAGVDGIEAGSVTGSVKLSVTGPQSALAIRTQSDLILSGTPARIAAAATLDPPARQVRLQTVQVDARGETARLLAPATVSFGARVAVDRLRIGVRQAVLEVAGEVSPRLDATATLRAPASLAAIAAPELSLGGTVALDARLTGTPAQPGGTIKLTGTGLRDLTGVGRAVPAGDITGTVQLEAGSAQVDARLTAGSARLAVSGRAPLGAGPLDLRETGSLDLAMLNPFIAAGGRTVRGRLVLDTRVNGSLAAPSLAGTVNLANGEVQDYGQGVHVSAIAADLRAEGSTVRIVGLTGRAGTGTIRVSGTVGALLPGIPLDLAITATDASPLASDLLTATLDANLTVRGPATGAIAAAGGVTIRRAQIQIPEGLPPTVATLRVIRPGQAPATARPSGPAPSVDLDIDVNAPGQVFVRGRGVDAVMFGNLRIRGAASAPQVSGGLEMRTGSISAAGQTLTFSRGKVSFGGTSIGGKIDPTLDFSADNTTNGVTATLAITGTAGAPKIGLTSVPSLPQDEVLAYLLFRRSVKDLGPFQIAEIAAALASLTGVGGGGGNVLDSVRQNLGLDRLSVGGASTGSGASVEAGRYVASGVYVGATQNTSGGTGAKVQIDLYKGLKLDTQVGTGTGGNQVGLTYQFEY